MLKFNCSKKNDCVTIYLEAKYEICFGLTYDYVNLSSSTFAYKLQRQVFFSTYLILVSLTEVYLNLALS